MVPIQAMSPPAGDNDVVQPGTQGFDEAAEVVSLVLLDGRHHLHLLQRLLNTR